MTIVRRDRPTQPPAPGFQIVELAVAIAMDFDQCRLPRAGHAVKLTEAEVVYVAVEATGERRHPVPVRGS